MKQFRIEAKLNFFKKFFTSESHTSFVMRFFIFSILFFIIWVFIGKYYLIFVAYISKFLLGFMGYDASFFHNGEVYFVCRGAEVGLTNAELVNYNIIPFLALIAATPKMSKWRIGKSLVVGLPILLVFHIINMLAHFPYYYENSSFAEGIIHSSGIINMGLPFLLWFILCYDYVLKTFKPSKKTYRCPICGERKVGIVEHIDSSHKNLSKKEKKKLQRFFDMHPEIRNKKKE